jgi:hypothetical protein
MDKAKFDELVAVAKPLQDWMMENFCMMNRVEVTCDSVTVLSPVMGAPMIAKDL